MDQEERRPSIPQMILRSFSRRQSTAEVCWKIPFYFILMFFILAGFSCMNKARLQVFFRYAQLSIVPPSKDLCYMVLKIG